MVDCQKTVFTTYYPALKRLVWEVVEHPFLFSQNTKQYTHNQFITIYTQRAHYELW